MTTATVTHCVVGRLRVRVSGTPSERNRALAAAQRQLGSRAAVSTDSRTGSALFTYDPHELDSEALIGLLREADPAFGDLEPPLLPEVIARPASAAALGVYQRFDQANRSVFSATQGRIDLRMLFPVALAGLAVRQLFREGLGLRSAPWYVLAYYAFDSYVKLHAGDIDRFTR